MELKTTRRLALGAIGLPHCIYDKRNVAAAMRAARYAVKQEKQALQSQYASLGLLVPRVGPLQAGLNAKLQLCRAAMRAVKNVRDKIRANEAAVAAAAAPAAVAVEDGQHGA